MAESSGIEVLGFRRKKRSRGSAVTVSAPVNTAAPVISGTATVGETLTSTTGTWTGNPAPTYAYQWERDGISIGSATSSTYLLVELDETTLITCAVTATNSEGSASADSNTLGPIAAAPSAGAPDIGTVTWATAADDTTPGFTFDLPVDAVAGDILHGEYSIASAGSYSDYFNHTITSGNITDDIITVSGVTPLAENNYDFRFRIERGATLGAWSPLVSVAVNSAPTVSSLSPADDATSIALSADLVITFNKSVQFGTGTINLYNAADTLIENWNVATEVGTGAGQVSVSGAAVTCKATGARAASTGHYVQIDATAIENLNDVAFAGIADKTTWSFTTAASGYTQTRVTFDGTNDYITYTDNSSIADSTGGTISFWADVAGGDTNSYAILNHGARVTLTRNTSGKLIWEFRNTSNVVIWGASGDTGMLAGDGLTHFAIAFNAAAGTGQFYRNGVSAAFTNATAPTTGTIDWARGTASAMFATNAGTGKYVGEIGDFWLDNTYIDLSTNIGNFISGGNPVDLTGYGTPAIWLGGTMDAAAWNAGTNLGNYTATLTMNGAVT